MRLLFVIVLLTVLLTVLLIGSYAAARNRVAVLGFQGPRGTAVRGLEPLSERPPA